MTAYNVVHMKAKADREAEFLALNQSPGHEVNSGLRKAALIKTGERSYCFIGEWEGMAAIVAARPDMVADLNRMRDMLEDLGNGYGITHAVSGEAVAERDNDRAVKEPAPFDFLAFKHAFETQDLEKWIGFYAPDAEWIEYRHNNPPHSPNRMVGPEQIRDFLTRVKGVGLILTLSDEIIGSERAAFCVTCVLPSGKQIIEHVILHLAGGLIRKQVDVEAWD